MERLRDLTGKTVLIGITGGIAAYKSVGIVSELRKRGAEVLVIMTESATELITPMTFQTVSANPVYTDMFAPPKRWNVEHIELAQRADLLTIVPATANIIAKMATGIADDFLSTTSLAFNGPKLVVPAMNTNMWNNPATQRNIQTLREFDCDFVEPVSGRLASGAEGKGRMADPKVIIEEISSLLHRDMKLCGKKVLTTAGPTREYFDPVRFLSNPSSGKMGFAIARALRERGAESHLVSGPVNISPPNGVKHHPVLSAEEMMDKCQQLWEVMDALFMTAAVSDYRPEYHLRDKLKKKSADISNISFIPTQDILRTLGKQKDGRFILGFAAETDKERAEARARDKLQSKNMDMIVLNIVGVSDNVVFGSDWNQVTLITEDNVCSLGHMHKLHLAREIVNRAVQFISE